MSSVPVPVPAPGHRIDSIDRLRGLVMVLMVLDHARDFMGLVQPPEQMADPGAALFLTRWVTHFCAPVFVLLAGVGAFFHGANRTRGELTRYLLSRGAWLLVLEQTVLFFGWMFMVPLVGLVMLQVIWALGWSMILLAGLIWLPRWAILAIALPVIFGHDALSRLAIEGPIVAAGMNPILDPYAQFWCVLHAGMKLFQIGGEGPWILVIYPLIPWFAVMAAGYAIGPLLRDASTRRRTCLGLGTVLTVLFVATRLAWPTLDLHSPFDQRGWIDFLNTSKYPPSLPFLLMTIGPAFLMMAGFDRLRGRFVDWLLVFGRVPLFFYIVHIYLAHVLGVIWVKLRCGVWFVNVMSTPPAEPPSLAEVYAAWLMVLLALYPLCRWFMRLKRRRRDLWWLSYL